MIVVSADALPAQIEAALDAGAEYYLTKPIDIAKLLGVVDQMLEEAVTRL